MRSLPTPLTGNENLAVRHRSPVGCFEKADIAALDTMSGTTSVTARESLDIGFSAIRMPHSSIATLNCADLGTYREGPRWLSNYHSSRRFHISTDVFHYSL